MVNTQELKEITHKILKLYIPEEKYDYICGLIDGAHIFGMASKKEYADEQNLEAEKAEKEKK